MFAALAQPEPKRSRDEVWQGDRGDTQGIRPDTDRVVGRAVGRGRPEDRGALCGAARRRPQPVGAGAAAEVHRPVPGARSRSGSRTHTGRSAPMWSHRKLVAMGFTGDERTTRRAVAEAKTAWRAGTAPDVSAVGAGAGAVVAVRLGQGPGSAADEDVAVLRLAGVVAVPGGDPGLGLHDRDAVANLDAVFRQFGGVADVRVVGQRQDRDVEHVAGVPVRHPQMVAARAALRLLGGVLRAVRPRVQGRGGGHREDREVPIWCPPTPNLLPATTRSPSWRRRARCSASGSTAGLHRETGKKPGRPARDRTPALHRVPGRPVRPGRRGPATGRRRTRRSAGLGALLHPARPRRHVRSGAGWSARNWSSPPTPPAGWPRSPGTGCPRRATRGSPTSTTPHHPDGRSILAPKPRARTPAEIAFLALGPVPSAG